MERLRPPGATTLLMVTCAAMTGCAVGPDYQRPQVATPEQYRYATEPAPPLALAETAWWQQFDDPILDGLIAEAITANADLRIATARVAEFAGRLGTASGAPFPQVGYDAGGARQRSSEDLLPPGTDPHSTRYSAVFTATWELDLWGKLRRATEAAQAELLAAEESRRAVVLTLVTGVASAYVDLLALDAQLEIARQTLAARDATLRIFEKRYAGGVVSQMQLSQVRSEYEAAAAAIAPLERDIARQEHALSVLLGRNPGPIARGRLLAQLAGPDIPAGLPSELLQHRPDVRQAEQTLIAANARIGVARALYYPSISLTGVFGTASSELNGLFGGPARTWSYGGSLLGPIFTAGAIRGQVEQVQAQQQQALAAYQQAIQNAFRDAEDALAGLQKAQEQLTQQARRVEALADYARLAQLRYDNGYSAYIEVLDAERSLFAAQLSFAQNQRDVQSARINLFKAFGGPWVDATATAAGAPAAPN